MKPAREREFVDLLDKLLSKGLILNADLIISVAGLPLIGVNLKAALAGIETMLEYGMMEAWDQRTREWYAKEYAKEGAVPLAEGEEMVLKTFGSFWDKRWVSPTWRPGFFYLTNKRLFLFRKEPAEILFEIPLDKLEGLRINKEMHYKKEREELYIQFDCGEVAQIHASNVMELKDSIEKSVGKQLEREIPISYENFHPFPKGEKIVRAEKLWYLFPAMGILGETWKPGRLYLSDKRLFWVYRVDNQKMFEVPLDKITSATIGFNGKKPGIEAGEKILTVGYEEGVALFGGNEEGLYGIKAEIERMTPLRLASDAVSGDYK
jgi:hypothetical protein